MFYDTLGNFFVAEAARQIKKVDVGTGVFSWFAVRVLCLFSIIACFLIVFIYYILRGINRVQWRWGSGHFCGDGLCDGRLDGHRRCVEELQFAALC